MRYFSVKEQGSNKENQLVVFVYFEYLAMQNTIPRVSLTIEEPVIAQEMIDFQSDDFGSRERAAAN